MATYDFHTAENAAVAHVVVYRANPDGSPEAVIADFYMLPGEPDIRNAEERAGLFLEALRLVERAAASKRAYERAHGGVEDHG